MNKKIEVFASEALHGELEDFPDIKRGWGITKESTGGIPPMKWFNAIQKRTDEAINAMAESSINGYSFKDGATLESKNDFIYDDVSNSWFFWTGEYPKYVQQGEQPDSDMWEPIGGSVGVGWVNYIDIRGGLIANESVYVYGRKAPLDGGAGYFQLDKNDKTSLDNDGTILVDINGGRWKRVYQNNVLPQWFGLYEYDDSYIPLQRAIDTTFNVIIPPGRYKCSKTLQRHKGQIISGSGVPERGLANRRPITSIEFTDDVDGISNVKNIANGGGIKNLCLIAPPESTCIGLLDGIKGQLGGGSQALACLHENVYVSGFKTCVQISGWCWETTLSRVHTDLFTDFGIAVYDAPNVINLYQCSATLSASKNYGERTGFAFYNGVSINVINPRSEGNRIGFIVRGGARVELTSPYSESNRDVDFDINDKSSSLLITNGVALHTNDKTTTAAIFRVGANCDRQSSLIVNGIKITASTGESGLDNKLSYMYVSSSDVYSEINGVTWNASGKLWADFSGRYSPTKITFTNTPGVEVRRVGNYNAVSIYYGFIGKIAPTTTEPWSIIGYDGSVIDLRYNGSVVLCNNTDVNINKWVWNGINWIER